MASSSKEGAELPRAACLAAAAAAGSWVSLEQLGRLLLPSALSAGGEAFGP